jgi:hypothetical protein
VSLVNSACRLTGHDALATLMDDPLGARQLVEQTLPMPLPSPKTRRRRSWVGRHRDITQAR